MRITHTVVPALGLAWALAAPAAAQPAPSSGPSTHQPAQVATPATPPGMVLEGAAGWAGFGDEGIIHHTLVGAAWRGYVTRRISLGPEVQFMSGPGSDRDLILTGNVMVDLLARTADRPRPTTPYVVLGGGLFRHTERFLTGTSTSTEGAFTLGVGLRTFVSERVYVATDARLGWEPHLRVAALVGVVLR
ncbi:MAG: hypothetical protein JNL48_10570 [Acidobacteria bacterium]|nr:hypothetical protein [Acidobacteriota bacterium]